MSTSTLERTPSEDSLFLAALREPCTESIEKPFTGFYDKFNFTVSVLALLTFGAIVNLLSIFPCYPTSLIGTIGTIACSIWYNLHGRKMTRNEVVYFNVSNMLEVEHTEFRFGLPANDDDCLTPGDGEQREAPQPQTLWDALFTDEKSMQMERFYKNIMEVFMQMRPRR